ncbi:hypothetical protein CK203_115680 [Vitis vinifera]|uniref:Uncharacterized protein n=1 Tax=Vitis vinifera TaxID=29760 RepID=A0A438CPL1_VITVI|nr:hypothetical protein CK203_115680 [Vitis vinifera]
MGYINVWEHYGGGQHTNADWSPIFEDLYSPKLGNPLGCQGSACVEVMTTLHRSTLSLRRHAEGCKPSEGMIASARDPLKSTLPLLEPPWPYQTDMDSQVVIVDQFVAAIALIQNAITNLAPQDTQIPPLLLLGQTVLQLTPFTLQSLTKVDPPPSMVVVLTFGQSLDQVQDAKDRAIHGDWMPPHSFETI